MAPIDVRRVLLTGPSLDTLGGDDGEPAAASGLPSEHPLGVPELGRYVSMNTIGAGGMGRVDVALDRRLLRQVAYKTPRHGSEAITRRLAHEALITAQLDHPGIVSVFDAGILPDGSIFYTMRLVRGKSLEAALVDTEGLSGRLELLRHYLAACEAIAYAHAAGIVHRDIKPENIMVGDFGETQVVDWGVAKELTQTGPDGGARPGLADDLGVETLFGDIIGTPAYMAPEQARPGAPATTGADIWSLGAVLYRLLAGKAPIGDVESSGRLLEAVRAGEHRTIERWERELLGDEGGFPSELKAIVSRAMSPDPAERYPDARALARDVAAFLDGKRVQAYNYSALEHLKRFVRAWKVPLIITAIGLVILAFVGAFAAASVVAERDRAVVAEGRAAARLAESLTEQAARHLDEGQYGEAELLAAQARQLTGSPEATALLMAVVGSDGPKATAVRALPDGCFERRLSPEGDRVLCSDGERLAVYRLREGADAPVRLWERRLQHGHPVWGPHEVGGAELVTVLAEGRHVAIIDSRDGAIVAGGRSSGQALEPTWEAVPVASRVVGGEPDATGESVVFVSAGWAVAAVLRSGMTELVQVCPDGLYVASAASHGRRVIAACSDGTLTLGEVDARGVLMVQALGALSDEVLARTPGRDSSPGAHSALSADGTFAAITTRGRVHLRFPTGEQLGVESGIQNPQGLRFSADGVFLVVPATKGGVRILQVGPAGAGGLLHRLPSVHGEQARWPATGLVTAGRAGAVTWALPTDPQPRHRYSAVGLAGLASVDVDPDETRVLVGGSAGRVGLYAVEGREELEMLHGPGVIKRARFLPGAREFLVSGAEFKGLRLIDAKGRASLWLDIFRAFRRFEPLADGRVLISAWEDPLRVVDVERRVVPIYPPEVEASMPPAADVDVHPDGRRAVWMNDDGAEVFVWDGEGVPQSLGRFSGARAVTFGLGGVLVAMPNSVVAVTLDGRELLRWRADGAGLSDVAGALDGSFVAVGEVDGGLTVWGRAELEEAAARWAVGDPAAEVRPVAKARAGAGGHRDRIGELRFSRRALWSASWDGAVRRWGLDVLSADAETLVEGATERWAMRSADVFGNND